VTKYSWRLVWAELVARIGTKGAQYKDFYSSTMNSEVTEHMERGREPLKSREPPPSFQ
jgi:hypothetical protein